VSQETYQVTVENLEGRYCSSGSFENSRRGAGETIDWLRAQRKDESTMVWVGTEGFNGWVAPLDRFLAEAEGIQYVPVIAKSVEEHRCHFPEDVTDAGDASVIADLVRIQVTKGTARVCEGWPGEIEESLRVCARTFQQITERKTQTINELRALCEAYLPDYLRSQDLPDLDSASFLAILDWCPNPAELAQRPLKEITALLRKASGGHHGEALARRFQEKAREMGLSLLDSVQQCIRIQVENLRRDSKQVKGLEAQMKALLKQLPYAREILSWRGVGARTLGCLLGEAGDLSRFDDEAAFARTAGVTPIRDQSGKRDRTRGGRRFNRRMKRAIMLMAETRARFHHESAIYYHAKREECENRFRALKSLARYIIRRIYTTWAKHHQIPGPFSEVTP
jgi:transposase